MINKQKYNSLINMEFYT